MSIRLSYWVKELSSILENKNSLILFLEEKISNQILITRSTETSAKNVTLYFNILLKSKDLIEHKLELIESFYKNAIKFRSGSWFIPNHFVYDFVVFVNNFF